jgi:ubiquinone/menaquinone biosynthesis C-methylase UbiE
MAKDWVEAQQNEQAFWSRWAGDHRPQATAPPIATEGAIDFARMNLARHGLSFADLDGKTLADVGCGPYGLILGILRSRQRFTRHPTLIGVDPLMAFYQQQIGLLVPQANVQLHAAKAENVPLADGSCDYVFCINALDHVDQPAAVSRELHRITRPGGLCAVSLHTVTRPFSPVRGWLRHLDKNHPHHLTVADVRRMLAAYFDEVELVCTVNNAVEHPEFSWRSIVTQSDKLLALLRWGSTFVLQTACFTCRRRK